MGKRGGRKSRNQQENVREKLREEGNKGYYKHIATWSSNLISRGNRHTNVSIIIFL